MTFGEKLSKCRKEANYTQEQLAELLGVSRQSVSKWESDIAYPETDKLIRLGKLFGCSMDYLLDNTVTEKAPPPPTADPLVRLLKCPFRERKSERLLFGMPLYHIGPNACGFFAIGLRAKGIFAVGLLARGIVSLGILSCGGLAIGLLSLGAVALGTLACGGLAAGVIALGLIAAGAMAIGVVSFGALSIGCFSAGALALGRYIAAGDHAQGMIALGKTKAVGSLYQQLGAYSAADLPRIKALLGECVPAWLAWAKNLFLALLR